MNGKKSLQRTASSFYWNDYLVFATMLQNVIVTKVAASIAGFLFFLERVSSGDNVLVAVSVFIQASFTETTHVVPGRMINPQQGRINVRLPRKISCICHGCQAFGYRFVRRGHDRGIEPTRQKGAQGYIAHRLMPSLAGVRFPDPSRSPDCGEVPQYRHRNIRLHRGHGSSWSFPSDSQAGYPAGFDSQSFRNRAHNITPLLSLFYFMRLGKKV